MVQCEPEASGEEAAMILARVKIGEFDQFWSVFTTRGAEHRRKYGSTGAKVFRNQQDENEVVVLFDWSEEDYKRFMADPQTREIMASAGVQGPPEHTAVEPVGETGS
jgi:heme-degrading monooxygenase HmoA